MPSRSTAWISEAGTPLGCENRSSVRSSSLVGPAAGRGDGGREVGVGGAELARRARVGSRRG